MDKIIVTLFKGESDCDDCGYTEAYCVDIKSTVDKVHDITLGNPDCCSMTSASLYDALKYIFGKLGVNMPYTNVTLKAMERVGDKNPSTMHDNGELSYKHMIRCLNPRWKVPYGSTLEETAIHFLAKQGIDLVIINEIEYEED